MELSKQNNLEKRYPVSIFMHADFNHGNKQYTYFNNAFRHSHIRNVVPWCHNTLINSYSPGIYIHIYILYTPCRCCIFYLHLVLKLTVNVTVGKGEDKAIYCIPECSLNVVKIQSVQWLCNYALVTDGKKTSIRQTMSNSYPHITVFYFLEDLPGTVLPIPVRQKLGKVKRCNPVSEQLRDYTARK